jgi:hypothetical protein
MTRVVQAEGPLPEHLIASTVSVAQPGLDREALARFDAAQARTVWAIRHRRRFVLMQADDVLASAERYHLTGRLDRQPVTICGIAAVLSSGTDDDGRRHESALVEQLIQDATRDGADLALLFRTANASKSLPDGFTVVPTTALALTVTESARYGAPMTLVRGGEDRDLEAIAKMGHVRASSFRFHLDRDVDFIKHAITRKRLLAGLGHAGVRQLVFVIAEEGITAAAYIVISIVAGTWTIEECGDRDASGARVGALLQALIAREPGESRPVIQGWLPPGFLPPQVTVASASPTPALLLARVLSPRAQGLPLSAPDVLYWLNDLF